MAIGQKNPVHVHQNHALMLSFRNGFRIFFLEVDCSFILLHVEKKLFIHPKNNTITTHFKRSPMYGEMYQIPEPTYHRIATFISAPAPAWHHFPPALLLLMTPAWARSGPRPIH